MIDFKRNVILTELQSEENLREIENSMKSKRQR